MTNQRAQTVRTSPPLRRRSGFTLAELLVVIGIIALLMAILFPVINKVKAQGWRADSMNQINVLRSAIDAYQLTFNAYPGPVANDVIINKNMPPIANVVTGTRATITMSENLFLGIAGGLRLTPNSNPPTVTYNAGAAGQGPASLNPRNPKVYAPFMENALKQSSKGKYAELDGPNQADDTNVPEFVDRFPQNPLPVLYLRAKVGAPGTGGQDRQQYSAEQIAAYTNAAGRRLGPLPTPYRHGLHEDGATPNAPLVRFPLSETSADGNPLLPYLMDRSLATTYTPRGKDTYILISPGSDRIYGTNDDLTSFGSVE